FLDRISHTYLGQKQSAPMLGKGLVPESDVRFGSKADFAAHKLMSRTSQNWLGPDGSCRPESNHCDERNYDEDHQHDALRDRERWFGLRRSQRIETRYFHKALRDENEDV